MERPFSFGRALKISATIITLNEERHLGQCLESLQNLAEELLIVDSGSTDKTLEIARRFGARIVVRSWTNYSDQKNFAASQASNDWILSLDADECLSSALRKAILALKTSGTAAAAFEFPRKALLPRPLDSSVGLVSRLQEAALFEDESSLGGGIRSRVVGC